MFKPVSLPYPINALEPFISTDNLRHHYEGHYKGYVNTLNDLIKDNDEYKNSSFVRIIRKSYDEEVLTGGNSPVFNASAQIWNHQFLWKCMTPEETTPTYQLASRIKKTFGSMSAFKDLFEKRGLEHFGSGWVWLIFNKNLNSLSVGTTSNAYTPVTSAYNSAVVEGIIPLLVCDVWEHAYYPTYNNDKAKYMKEFWNVVNWDFVSTNYRKAAGK